MPGLTMVGGDSEKGKFLGFRLKSRPVNGSSSTGNIGYNADTEYLSGDTFQKACRVRIIAFTGASNDHQNINVQLSGVGELISAWDNDKRSLRYVNNVYNISPGQYLTVNNSGNYSGVSGYIAYLED